MIYAPYLLLHLTELLLLRGLYADRTRSGKAMPELALPNFVEQVSRRKPLSLVLFIVEVLRLLWYKKICLKPGNRDTKCSLA